MLNTPTIKEAQMMIAAILATCAAASSLADQIRAAQRRSRKAPVESMARARNIAAAA